MIPKYRAYINERVGIVSVKRICFYPPFIDFEWENEIGVMQIYSEDLDKVKLMQSTGLIDTNGIEIFEGDIVRLTEKTINGRIDTHTCRVFQSKNGGWRIEYHPDFSRKYTRKRVSKKHTRKRELYSVRNRIEIIGNVHENVEFMEEQE